MSGLSTRTFYDVVEERLYSFTTDASQSTIDGLPEAEWHSAKHVLINFGYTVIEINDQTN